MGKRLVDLVVAISGLVLLSPLLAVIALAVKLHDRGPIVFRQTRIGSRERAFVVLKLRTMPVDTPDLPSSAATSLPITPVGRLLRRTSLDELPQLWNVVKGDMSIVGPRPALPSQDILLRLRSRSGVSKLRPGLTGLAQVNGYDDMPDTEKAAWDAEYLRTLSFHRDISIAARTAVYLFRSPPTY